MALPEVEEQTRLWQSPISHERVNPTFWTMVGLVLILQTRGLPLNPWVPSVNLRGNHPLPRPAPQLVPFPPTSSPTLVPVPFPLDSAPQDLHPPRASALLPSDPGILCF